MDEYNEIIEKIKKQINNRLKVKKNGEYYQFLNIIDEVKGKIKNDNVDGRI